MYSPRRAPKERSGSPKKIRFQNPSSAKLCSRPWRKLTRVNNLRHPCFWYTCRMRTIKRDVVGAFIFSSDNKILLGKSRKGGVYHGTWMVPGGGIEEGETMRDAVIREIREEVGVDISPFDIKLLDDPQTNQVKRYCATQTKKYWWICGSTTSSCRPTNLPTKSLSNATTILSRRPGTRYRSFPSWSCRRQQKPGCKAWATCSP